MELAFIIIPAILIILQWYMCGDYDELDTEMKAQATKAKDTL